MKITKENREFIEELLNDGFEIWNSSCTLRMTAAHGFSDKPFAICEYHDPLHPVKEYKSLEAAFKYMEEDKP